MLSEDARQQTRNAQFAAFRSGDGDDVTDVCSRLAVVLVCGVTVWYFTGLVIMLVWCFGYWALNLIYIFGLLRRKSGDVSRVEIGLCIFLSSLVALWYCAMAVYFATLGDGDFVFLASCGVLGLALHCLSGNVEFSYSAYIDFLAVILTGLTVTVFAAMFATTRGGAIASVIGGLCACGYFWLSFYKVISVNRALAEKIRADAQNQKMLALGQLASGVAHDFNNLLTVISGNIELVLLNLNSSETEDFLTEAKSASDKSAVLVRQLLAFGRKYDLRASKVDLGVLFKDLKVLLQRILPANITLDIQAPSQEQNLFVDKALLESALMNLIINGQKAIGDKPGSIRLSAIPDASGQCVLIHVTDTGPGMTPDVLARAAEPFFTTRPIGEGSGLGLSMANGFATQSGGRLTFANQPDGGFRATIELPISKLTPTT